MDLMSVIAAVPGIGPWLPYVLAIGAVCAAVATMLPPPAVPASGVYAAIYGLVNFLGLNFGHARNIGAPASMSGPSKPVLLALLCVGLSLSACAANTAGGNLETATLAAARIDPATASRIVVGANFGATLACRVGPQLLAVGNVQVKGASAAAVAAACAAIDPAAVPAPAPVGAVLPLVTAPPAVAAAVVASQAAQQALNGARS